MKPKTMQTPLQETELDSVNPQWQDPHPLRLIMKPMRFRTYDVASVTVVGRLWRLEAETDDSRDTVGYAISLENHACRRLCLVGHDARRAKELFEMLIRNTVSPCSLQDVLEDLID